MSDVMESFANNLSVTWIFMYVNDRSMRPKLFKNWLKGNYVVDRPA